MLGVVCLPELPGEPALLRRPNKKGKGELLDNASLKKLLAEFRAVMGKMTLGLVESCPINKGASGTPLQ